MAQAATYDRNVLIHDQRVIGGTPDYLAKPSNIIWTKQDTPLDWIMHTVAVKASEVSDGKLVNLYIIGHGTYQRRAVYEQITDGYGIITNQFVTQCGAFYGGYGLQVGKEEITMSTLDVLDQIKDKIGKIIVYSCGAAGGVGALISHKTVKKTMTDKIVDKLFKNKPFSENEYTYVEADEDPDHVNKADNTCSSYTTTTASDRQRGVQFRYITNLVPKHELMTAICKKTLAVVIGADKAQRYKSDGKMIDFEGWEGQLYQYEPPNGNPSPIFRPAYDYF